MCRTGQVIVVEYSIDRDPEIDSEIDRASERARGQSVSSVEGRVSVIVDVCWYQAADVYRCCCCRRGRCRMVIQCPDECSSRTG